MVTIVEATKGKIRDKPISKKLRSVLEKAAKAAGIDTVTVTSGGQVAKGTKGKRTGSVRHDLGNAADIQLSINGRTLDFTKPQDRAAFSSFAQAAAAAGATGIGAAVGYMGPNTMHVGFGKPSVWGVAGTARGAPTWLREAVMAGWGGQMPAPKALAAGELANLWGRENFAPPAEVTALGSKTLKPGMRGPEVAALQQTLNQYGYNVDIDGRFGPATKAALEAYQADMGLDPDGVVGQQTRTALAREIAQASAVPTPRANPMGGPLELALQEAAQRRAAELQQAGPITSALPPAEPAKMVQPEQVQTIQPQEVQPVTPEMISAVEAAPPQQALSIADALVGMQAGQAAPQPSGPLQSAIMDSAATSMPSGPLNAPQATPAPAAYDPNQYASRATPDPRDGRQVNQQVQAELANGWSVPGAFTRAGMDKTPPTPRANPLGPANAFDAGTGGGVLAAPSQAPQVTRSPDFDFAVGPNVATPSAVDVIGSMAQPQRSPDFDFAVGPSNAPVASRQSFLTAAPQTRTPDFDAVFGPAQGLTPQASPTPAPTQQQFSDRFAGEPMSFAQSPMSMDQFAGRFTGQGPLAAAVQAQKQTANVTPTQLASLPSRTIGPAPGMAPLAGVEQTPTSIYTPKAPVPRMNPVAPAPVQEEQPKGLLGGLSNVMTNPLARGVLGFMTGGPLGAAIGVGSAMIGNALGGRGLLGSGLGGLGYDAATAARNAAFAGSVNPSDRVGGAYGSASYGRTGSDGITRGTTSSGKGWSSDGKGNYSVGGRSYSDNKQSRGSSMHI